MTMTKPTSEQVTFLAAGAGATQRTALEKFRDVVSVKDFGAVGDGVTNDLAAFRNAIAAINAAGGGTLYVPGGDYAFDIMFTGAFTLNTSIWLCRDLTIVMDAGVTMRVLGTWSAGKKYMLMGASPGGLYTNAANIRIYGNGARIIGVPTTSSVDPDLTHGLWFNAKIDNVQIHDLIVEDCGSCAKLDIDDSIISGCTFIRGENVCVAVTECDNVSFIDCTFNDCVAGGTPGGGSIVEAGVDVEPNAGDTCKDVFFRNCTFSGNYKYGLYAHPGGGVATYNIVVDGCRFINNGRHAVAIDGTGASGSQANNVIENCFMEGNASDATTNAASLLVGETFGTVISNNRIYTSSEGYGLRSVFNKSMNVDGNVFIGGGGLARPAVVQVASDIGGCFDNNVISNGAVENLSIQFSSGTMFSNNYISNSVQSAIRIADNSTNIEFVGNTFANACTGSGNQYIVATSANQCSYSANKFVSSEQYTEGTITAYSTTPSVTATLSSHSGNLIGYVGTYLRVGSEAIEITAYNNSTGVVTLASSFTSAPTPGSSTYQITGPRAPQIGILHGTSSVGISASANDFYGSLVTVPYYDASSGQFFIDWPADRRRSVSSAYTATLFDHFIEVDATSAGVTVTLPTTANNRALNKTYVLKKIDSSANAVTIDGNGAETIDGAATQSLTTQYQVLRIVGTTSGWSVI
jgi:hypothetical protein